MNACMMNAIHGKPMLSTPQGSIIHTSTNKDCSAYLFAYSISTIEDILRVYTQFQGNKTLITSSLLSSNSPPTLILNGYILSKGSALVVESDNAIVCTGWVSVEPVSKHAPEELYCNHMKYSIQSIVPSTENALIDPKVPVTLLCPSNDESTLTLPNGEDGCVKTIIMKCDTPKVCFIRVNCFNFPEGQSKSTGVLKFSKNGDSAQLIWTGCEWMISNSGCEVL